MATRPKLGPFVPVAMTGRGGTKGKRKDVGYLVYMPEKTAKDLGLKVATNNKALPKTQLIKKDKNGRRYPKAGVNRLEGLRRVEIDMGKKLSGRKGTVIQISIPNNVPLVEVMDQIFTSAPVRVRFAGNPWIPYKGVQ